MSDIVPFGKYKNQEVSKLLADRTYCEWLKAQPWLANFKDIYNVIVVNQQEDTPTPEHNAIQIKFLEQDYLFKVENALHCRSIPSYIKNNKTRLTQMFDELDTVLKAHNITSTRVSLDDEMSMITEIAYKNREGALESTKIHFKIAESLIKGRVAFEPENGADVLVNFSYPISMNSYMSDECKKTLHKDVVDAISHTAKVVDEIHVSNYRRFKNIMWFSIEIKPKLGDDYPCVLRQIQKQKAYDKKNHDGDRYYILLIGHFESSVITFEQLKKYFLTEYIVVVTEDEIQSY